MRFRSEQNKAEQNLFHKLVQSGSFENKTCTHITSHVIQERSTEHSLETRIDTRCFLLKKHFEDTWVHKLKMSTHIGNSWKPNPAIKEFVDDATNWWNPRSLTVIFWTFLAFDFSSPPQRPMTSDFEGFSISEFIHYIYFPILILEKEPVFSLLNVQC